MSHGWDRFRGSSAFVACRSTILPTDVARVVTVPPGVSVHRFVDSVRVVFSTNSTLVRLWLPLRLQSALDVLRCVCCRDIGDICRADFSSVICAFVFLLFLRAFDSDGFFCRSTSLNVRSSQCVGCFDFWGFVIAIYDAGLR